MSEIASFDLEFADPPPYDQGTLLGETGGRRGAGMTSPDVGIRHRDRDGSRGVVLIEVKYTETGFGTCSEYRRLAGSQDRARCLDLGALVAGMEDCPYRASGRRYIEAIRDAMRATDAALPDVCPAASGAYQILRQQALAESLVAEGAYQHATSVVAYPVRNHELTTALNRISSGEFTLQQWGTLFGGGSTFSSFLHEHFVDFIEGLDGPLWTRRWLQYTRERYFPGQ